MRKKLSPVQASVLEALRKKGAILKESKYYHWSSVIKDGKELILSIHKPTVEFFKKNKMIIPVNGSNCDYILNPEWLGKSFNVKTPKKSLGAV